MARLLGNVIRPTVAVDITRLWLGSVYSGDRISRTIHIFAGDVDACRGLNMAMESVRGTNVVITVALDGHNHSTPSLAAILSVGPIKEVPGEYSCGCHVQLVNGAYIPIEIAYRVVPTVHSSQAALWLEAREGAECSAILRWPENMPRPTLRGVNPMYGTVSAHVDTASNSHWLLRVTTASSAHLKRQEDSVVVEYWLDHECRKSQQLVLPVFFKPSP